MSLLYKYECFLKKEEEEDGLYLKSLNLGSFLIRTLLIILLGLGTMLSEQITPKKYINQDRRRSVMAVIIQRGVVIFLKLCDYNLTLVVLVYFQVTSQVGFLHAQGHIGLIQP